MSQSISPTEAHERVLRWSFVLTNQIDRLREARARAVESQRERFATDHYGPEAAHPFHILEAERHFVLVAARQLLRALEAFDGDNRLPSHVPAANVRNVRDALEHWDEPQGRAARRMRQVGASPTAHAWSIDGAGLLSDLLEDSQLKNWAKCVYDELVDWSPWDSGGPTAP